MDSYEAKEKLGKKLEMIELLAEECREMALEYELELDIQVDTTNSYSNVWSSSSQQC